MFVIMLRDFFIKGVFFCLIPIILESCSPSFYQPFGKREAELGPETPATQDLANLPEPHEPIVVAVYKFRDQSGQYKPSEIGANWSTAVTQGATNILIRALEESGWFIPIERENISNLLNERKIIRSSRQQYEGGDNVMLPPLLFAGVLLEGGIVSYEANVFTGGAGARYFGMDASAQYREDRVSIYLRAVSTSNGKILKTVYTTKSILSQEVSVGVFRYVSFKRILEAEAGYTYNEPTEIAITEAVEKAVHSLIIEGILDNLWELENEYDMESDQIQEYLREKYDNSKENFLGIPFDQNLRARYYASLRGSGQFYLGDYSSSGIGPGGALNLGLGLSRSFFLELDMGIQNIKISNVYSSYEFFNALNVNFLTNPNGKFSPYLTAGVGIYHDFGSEVGLSDLTYIPYFGFAGGLEYLFSDRIGLTGKTFFNNMWTDYYDGVPAGKYNDNIWGFELGVKFYMGKTY